MEDVPTGRATKRLKTLRKNHTEARNPIPSRDDQDSTLVQAYDKNKRRAKDAGLLCALSEPELECLVGIIQAQGHASGNPLGCFKYTEQGANNRGYVYLGRRASRQHVWYADSSKRGTRKFLATHVVLASSGCLPDPKLLKPNASHTCKNKACVLDAHLCWEEEEVNLSRNGCVPQATCPCCSHTFSVCKHQPPCLV